MTFDELLAQVLELLQREQRLSYQAIKRRFAFDDEYLEDLKAELVEAKRLAIDEDGKVLVWIGGTAVSLRYCFATYAGPGTPGLHPAAPDGKDPRHPPDPRGRAQAGQRLFRRH